MHPTTFKKHMVAAYLAGAAAVIDSDIREYPSKKEANDWYTNEYGLTVAEEECDCCEENEDGDT
jgi:hypothetical protein